MGKKHISIFIAILITLSNVPAFSGEETSLSTLYFTSMTMQNNFNDLKRLNDGNYSNAPIVVSVPATGDYKDNYCIEGVFDGNMVNLTSIIVGCWASQIGNQNVTKARVDCYNAETNTWYTVLESYQLSWTEGNPQSMILLPSGVITSKVRFYILESNRTWNNFRIEELLFRGSVTGKVDNISSLASVNVSYPIANGKVTDIIDAAFTTELVSAGRALPSVDIPCVITLDYQDKIYAMKSMEIGSRYARDSGLKNITVEYKIYGVWKKLKDIEFDRGKISSTDNYEIDEVNLNINASGIRIIITKANTTWNNFRVGEILIYGNEIDTSDMVEDMTETCNVYMPDGSKGTSWLSNFQNEPSIYQPHIVEISRDFAFIPKVVKFKSDGITDVIIGFRADSEFVLLNEFYNISYSENICVLEISNSLMLDNFELQIVKADKFNYTIEDLTIYANDPTAEIIKLVDDFEENGKYSIYQSALSAANAINHSKTKEKMITNIEMAANRLRDRQIITAEYDVKEKKVKLGGYIFASENDTIPVTLQLSENIYTKNAKVNDLGVLDTTLEFSEIKVFGTYTVIINVNEQVLDTTFETREIYNDKNILDFEIDGVKALIKDNKVQLSLPHYGSLKQRITIFKLSEGARMFYKETEIKSGETTFDYSGNDVFRIIAEDNTTNDYTIEVKLSQQPESPSGGGGGGTPSKPRSEISLPIINEQPVAENISFLDLAESHWAYNYIIEMKKNGIIDGDGDKFYPDNNVKREEFVKMIVNALNIQSTGENVSFDDIIGHWSERFIMIAAENQLVNGIDEKNFGVNRHISREEIAVIIYRSLPPEKRNADLGQITLFEDDGDIEEYAKEAVYTLKTLGIIDGYNNRFLPKSKATRAEAIKILSFRRSL